MFWSSPFRPARTAPVASCKAAASPSLRALAQGSGLAGIGLGRRAMVALRLRLYCTWLCGDWLQGRRRERRWSRSSVAASMAVVSRSAHASPESEGWRVERRVRDGEARALGWMSRGAIGRKNMRQRRAAMVGARSHAWATRRPFTEHVACVAVPDLKFSFGPALLRTGLWALKQNYSPSDALQN